MDRKNWVNLDSMVKLSNLNGKVESCFLFLFLFGLFIYFFAKIEEEKAEVLKTQNWNMRCGILINPEIGQNESPYQFHWRDIWLESTFTKEWIRIYKCLPKSNAYSNLIFESINQNSLLWTVIIFQNGYHFWANVESKDLL